MTICCDCSPGCPATSRRPCDSLLEDRSYETVAESLGMRLGTVKNLLHRARKRLIELARPEEVKAA